MKYTVKRTAVLACAALMIGSVSLAASTPKVQAMGLPNPIVTYDTYESVVKDAGFTPLYLTRDAGFSCYYLSLIGKNTADIGFQVCSLSGGQKQRRKRRSASARCRRKPINP